MESFVPVTVPLDVRGTLGSLDTWGASTWSRLDDGGCWYAQRERSGPATIHLVQRPDGVQVRAWGPGADRLVARVPALLGLDAMGAEDVVPHHRAVAAAAKRVRGLRVGRSGRLFARLVAVALAQKVTGVNSKAATWRLARQWGERAPGPRDDLFLLPPPRQLATTPYYAFHPLNIERRRAELVRRIASRISALERAATMSDTDAAAHLQKLPGIGPWTAGAALYGTYGHADLVPTGDVHLPGIIGVNLGGDRHTDDAGMLRLLEPYRGHRGLVVQMLKRAGATPERRGARTPPMEIRGR